MVTPGAGVFIGPAVAVVTPRIKTPYHDHDADTFFTLGYAGTSLDNLARVTGLGKQSIYNSFGGKHELFLRVLSERTADAIRAVDEALNNPDSSPLERVRARCSSSQSR